MKKKENYVSKTEVSVGEKKKFNVTFTYHTEKVWYF